MKTNTSKQTETKTQASAKPGLLKIGMDVHKRDIVFCCQYNNEVPKKAQRMTEQTLVPWIRTKLKEGWEVKSCYEAGPMGFTLHRKLEALEVANIVVAPVRLEANVKTDKPDAACLLANLDRWLNGNKRVFTVIRVLTEDEQKRRSLGRQRKFLIQQSRSTAASVRGTALFHGYDLKGKWWSEKNWEAHKKELPEWLAKSFECFRDSILADEKAAGEIHEQLKKEDKTLKGVVLPKGFGEETAAAIEHEVCDFGRFKNRRQVSSYTGCVPTEDTSGPRQFRGSITKHGNRRIRHLLIEAAWRLVRWQPNYYLIVKWQDKLDVVGPAARKKIIVAIARQFAVDWWRIRTNKTTLEKLGLIPA